MSCLSCSLFDPDTCQPFEYGGHSKLVPALGEIGKAFLDILTPNFDAIDFVCVDAECSMPWRVLTFI